MLEPDVALTDYALAVECVLFAAILYSRKRTGSGGRLSSLFSFAFFLLSLASVLGGTYHGFFSQSQEFVENALWIGTMLTIGAMSFVNWLVAAEIQLNAKGKRLVLWIAATQYLVFSIYAITVSEDFLAVSVNSVPPMLFLLVGYVRIVLHGGKTRARLGLLGALLVFLGALLQHLGFGISPEYLSSDALYHVIQAVAFLLLFLSVPELEERKKLEPSLVRSK